jgi:hypothetical protein
MRGGVNEGWPGWASGSNPVRARGLRNGGKHLDPSGSASLRGEAKEGDLGRNVRVAGDSRPAAKSRRRHRCSSTFEEGSSRIACSPSSRGDSTHAMSSVAERRIVRTKARTRLAWLACHRPG